MKIIFLFIILFLSQILYSQIKLSDTTRKIPFDTNKIQNQTLLSGTSEVYSYDSLYIWNDRRTLSEILNERKGFFIYDFGLGERNDINYNGMYSSLTGIYRDGIQINDNYYQSFDIQNISVNEIDRIEEISDVSSFFYGINSFSKSVNVITKDIFQSKPFSQLRYSQDRFGSLYADMMFSQPFSRKGNVQLGITKHSIDGRYENSAFDIWRARGRINLFFSPKLNAKLNFYLDNYERGLNEGLIYSEDPNNLSDPEVAQVFNPEASEDLENYFYDLTLTGRLFRNKNSLTKFKLYSNNSTRQFINPDSTYTFKSDNIHSIVYGSELIQNVNIQHSKYMSSDILAGGNVYVNLFSGDFFQSYQENYYSIKAKYDFKYKNFFISGLIRNDNISDTNYLNAGAEAKVIVYSNKDFSFELNGGINKTNYIILNKALSDFYENESNYKKSSRSFYEAGAKITYKDFAASGEGYNASYGNTDYYGINSTLSYISKYSDLSVSYNFTNSILYRTNFFKSDLAYTDVLFKGKLKLKTGFNLKYYNIKYITFQSQAIYSTFNTTANFPQQNQFIADFYVGARIGRANVNITVGNIFNSLVYNTYIYPLDDRGGLLNAISRFTIVWDFIN